MDGWDGWSGTAVRKLLWSPTAIGVFVWNKTRREYDWEQEKTVKIRNPHSEWEVRYDRKLAIVPMERWRAARRKLAAMRRASPLTGRKPSRNQVSSTTLFSGTLFCEYCGEELKLIRSTEKYKQLGCFNGLARAHECKLAASKSVRIVEECLLAYLHDAIITDSQIEALVAKANADLESEAQKPQVNTAPLKAKIRKLETTIKKLVVLIEEEPDETLCVAYNHRVKELQKELNTLLTKVRDAVAVKKRALKPLSVKKAKEYLSRFREILKQDIPAAAAAIRTLTGPIKIRQEPIPGRKDSNRWIATFSPDLFQLLRGMAGDELRTSLPPGERADQRPLEVVIDKIPKYERLAPEFKRLHESGVSIQTIAASNGMAWKYAADIIHFAETGERPKWGARKEKTGTGHDNSEKYKEIADEVARLRDEEKMTFPRIAKAFGVHEATTRRAYDHARPQAVREAAATGDTPNRGTYSHLPQDIFKTIRELLLEGKMTAAEIAAKAGCSANTVYRVRRKMKSESGEAPAA